eukprot:3875269-Prymnesium_polylepis.1
MADVAQQRAVRLLIDVERRVLAHRIPGGERKDRALLEGLGPGWRRVGTRLRGRQVQDGRRGRRWQVVLGSTVADQVPIQRRSPEASESGVAVHRAGAHAAAKRCGGERAGTADDERAPQQRRTP